MRDRLETELAAIGVRLLDDAALAWFRAETECEEMLQAWFQSTGQQRESAYRSYLAALDREEASARDLERLWRLAESCNETLAQRAETVAE